MHSGHPPRRTLRAAGVTLSKKLSVVPMLCGAHRRRGKRPCLLPRAPTGAAPLPSVPVSARHIDHACHFRRRTLRAASSSSPKHCFRSEPESEFACRLSRLGSDPPLRGAPCAPRLRPPSKKQIVADCHRALRRTLRAAARTFVPTRLILQYHGRPPEPCTK